MKNKVKRISLRNVRTMKDVITASDIQVVLEMLTEIRKIEGVVVFMRTRDGGIRIVTNLAFSDVMGLTRSSKIYTYRRIY